MMKRYLLSIILGFLALSNISYGQLEINFASETANANGTVDIDVTTNGFTDISVLQFSAGWDSLVIRFNSVTFTNPELSDLMASNISGPTGAANVDPGQFSFSYGSPTGDGNLDDGEVLFTVRFDVVGDECDETSIELTGDPAPIEAFNANFDELTVSSVSGDFQINGSDCGMVGGDELTITASTLNADAGSTICVPLSVENFIAVQAGSGTILWDPTVISYTGLMNVNLGGVEGSLNATNVENGELKFVWSNPDPANPLTITDGEPIFEICFNVVGSAGDMSPITLSTQGSLGFEWTDDDDNVIPQELVNGKVTIIEVVGDPFTLNVSDIDVDENTSNACVNISVENFDNILSTQYVITWDASVLSNANPDNFNLSGLNDNNFNIDGNCATLSWSGISGINVPNGTSIYSMCFDVIGDCDSSSPINLVAKGSTMIEIVDGNTDIIDNVSINAGSINVVCPEMCFVVSTENTCAGSQGGNVTVNVPTTNCTYSWANSSGVEVSTDRNLLGVGAGTYILTVICNGEEACTLSATIDNFDELLVVGNVTNAGCGALGAIDVSVTMGTGDYDYNWNPAQGNTANISSLNAGPYQLTVTDNETGCTKTAEFQVLDEVTDLSIASSIVVDESCLQNDGSISLSMNGGCQPYTFAWSDSSIGNTPIANDLSEGTYSVTVTDNSTPANSVSQMFTVDGADPITQVGTANITPSSGSDGSISFEVTGGDPDYNYNWTGPTTGLPNSASITGLMNGDYTVTVTDSNGCEETFSFTVPFINVNDPEPEIQDVSAVNDENGFSIKCNGDMTGSITGFISQGTAPFTVDLSGDATQSFEVTSTGTFNIENLSAGTYSVSVSNSDGSDSVEDIIVTEPDLLQLSTEKGCDNEEQCDGFIDVNVSGGFGDLTYDWGSPDLIGASLDDLCQDSYTVIVTDENGCQMTETVVIEPCNGGPDPDCYEVRDIITPNGDGLNDQFAVTCITDFPATLEVFDRWGKLVFSQNQYDGSWMGISNTNEALIEGGYMYILNIDFGQGRREIMKGTLTILRD